MIANERRRFNSLYSTEPDVIVIIRKEIKVNGRLMNPTSRNLFYTICHGSEITFALNISTIIIDQRELV